MCQGKKSRLVVLLGLLLATPVTLSAPLNEPRKLLIEQIQQGDYISAYATAKKLFDEYAGDADFDYLYGLTARANGYHQDAIFAFERVLMNQPKHVAARLALAVEYYQVNNLADAEKAFKRAAQLTSDSAIKEKIDAHLARIQSIRAQREKRWSGYLKASAGYDSNVNFGLGDELYPIPIPGIGVADFQFPEQGDQFQKLAVTTVYQQPLSKFNRVFASLNAEKTFYSELNQLEQSFVNLMTGFVRLQGRYQYNATFLYQKFWFGGEDYHNVYALSGRLGYALNDQQKVRLDGSYSIADNQQNENLDLDSLSLKLSFEQQVWNGKSELFVSARQEDIKHFNERSQHYQRDLIGIGLNIEQTFEQITIAAGWQYEKAMHQHQNMTILDVDGVSPYFSEKRQDHMRQYQLSLGYQINSQFSVNLTAKRNDKLSNQFLYSYDRNSIVGDLQFSF